MLKRFLTLVALFLAPAACCAQARLALDSYPNVRSASDVVEQWNASQHLYVKGDLGIGARQYAELESWLDSNAPHWTVVLFRNARGEVYRSLEQRTYQDMDAVEYALGRGLALRTSFGDLRHPQTGETDGAVFVLFLDERKFSYYASVAQDVRSLGESRWVGELDRPAFRAMRGGGRILDAVKDTILNINSRLEQRITSEREQAVREIQSKQRAVVNLKSDIQSLHQSIQASAEKAESLRQAFSEAKGELTSPPTDDWRRTLQEVEGFLTTETIDESRSRYEAVSHDVEGYLNAYADYESFDERRGQLQAEIDQLLQDPVSAGRSKAQEASQLLQDAEAARADGQRGIAAKWTAAQDAIADGRTAIAAEVERRRREEARRNLIRRTMMVTAAVLSLIFVGVLIWLNRRRAPAKARAEAALHEREQMTAAEMDKVYKLFDRSGEILGDKEKVRKRGYAGTTKKLTDNAFEDVDDLFVMSTEVERVMGEAREMIRPTKTTGKLANLISASRYEQGVNRISGEPLRFHRDKGLPLVIQRESERTGGEPPEEVTMTFDKVFEAFHERTNTAEETLNTIEHSLLEVDDSLKVLQAKIEKTSTLDQELSAAADDDGLFRIPALFEKLLPSAQDDFDEADQIAATDPVAAIQGQIPRGIRKMTDALAVVSTIQFGRQHVFPRLNEVAPQLQELDYNTHWIQDRVHELGQQANQLLEAAVVQPIEEDASQFELNVREFGERVERTLALAGELKDNAVPAMDALDERIREARRTIASRLGIAEQNCLQESEANPDLNLAAAKKQWAAAQAALQHGEVAAAEAARTALHSEVDTAQEWVSRSLQVLEDFERRQLARHQQHDGVRDKVPRHEELLEGIQQEFAASALSLQAGDATYEDAAATVWTHLEGARDALNDARGLMDRAAEKYRQGQLLEADSMLLLTDQHCQEADTLLGEISEHCTKLKAAARENEGQLASMQRGLELQRTEVFDAKTTRPTIAFYEATLGELQAAQTEIIHHAPRDPFYDARAIERFVDATQDLKARTAADRESHAEAARAVAGAKAKREVAEQLIQQARHDGIPDSPTTTSGIREVQMYDGQLAELERELLGSHNDWKSVDQMAAKIHGELGVKVGRLRGELDRAQQLVAVFQTASDLVFEATRWTGGFGTRIFGSPGSKELEQARRALNSGDYAAMAELARAAQIAAQHAIQRAQREVYRRQREEARRQEEARRRRRRSSGNFGGGGGISFPSIGRGGGGGGGGGGGSSRGSSGSGFSRSGW